MEVRTLKKLLRRRDGSRDAPKLSEPSLEESEQERTLLQRLAAGIALNKMPPR
jgi:hypothetical protein